MIGYLRGRVLSLQPEYILLDVNGVGYEVICSGAAFANLSGVKKGEEGEVYTYLQVSEQGVALYGFSDLKEKELFLRLTSVQGVGAKLAIAALSSLRPADLAEAIYMADVKRLCWNCTARSPRTRSSAKRARHALPRSPDRRRTTMRSRRS